MILSNMVYTIIWTHWFFKLIFNMRMGPRVILLANCQLLDPLFTVEPSDKGDDKPPYKG